MQKIKSIPCINQELIIDITKFKGLDGEKHLSIKVTIDQTFDVETTGLSTPVRRIQRLVTQELELY